jgi:serralysin
MFGGTGNDTYLVTDAADTVFETIGEGTADRVVASTNFVLAAGQEIETLQTDSAAGISAINLTGNEINNAVVGNAGANILSGGGGNDTLSGLLGDDMLIGGDGNDRLDGGLGIDTLIGASGADVLFGGAGNDKFIYTNITDSAVGARDSITDFTSGQDVIDLSAIDADTIQAGDQAFSFIGSAAFHGAAGELRFAAGILTGDVNGDGVADFQIGVSLVGAPPLALNSVDFVL